MCRFGTGNEMELVRGRGMLGLGRGVRLERDEMR